MTTFRVLEATSFAFAMALFFLAPAHANERPALDVVNGHDVTLQVVLIKTGEELTLHGWARPATTRFGEKDAHLHIEPLDNDGRALTVLEGRWTGPLNIRGRSAARIDVALPSSAIGDADTIRVRVAPGANDH